MSGPHHTGNHGRYALIIRQQAEANPNTQCQADNCKGWGNRTLAEHPPTNTGRPPTWTAGHITAGRVATSIRDYRPEVATCNYADGGRLRHAELHTERW